MRTTDTALLLLKLLLLIHLRLGLLLLRLLSPYYLPTVDIWRSTGSKSSGIVAGVVVVVGTVLVAKSWSLSSTRGSSV